MKKIVELIELEEKHRAAANQVKAKVAQKVQDEAKNHKNAMSQLDQRIRDKDEAINSTVEKERASIAQKLEKDDKSSKANSINPKDLENIILQHVK